MTLDSAFVYSFFLVFVRCSAMFLSAPVFGSPNVPIRIRIMTALVVSAALATALQPSHGPLPKDVYDLAAAAANEALAGLIIGVFVHIVMIGAQMGGSLMDLQVGLSMSHVMNPANGQASTVLSQFKYMLAIVVFLSVNGHHVMLNAFARSFELMPSVGVGTLAALQENLLWLVGQLSLVALQIAAPILAVSILVDAALGIMNKAVPQMQIFIVGMPAKIAMGLMCVSVALPATAAAVLGGVESATDGLFRLMGAK